MTWVIRYLLQKCQKAKLKAHLQSIFWNIIVAWRKKIFKKPVFWNSSFVRTGSNLQWHLQQQWQWGNDYFSTILEMTEFGKAQIYHWAQFVWQFSDMPTNSVIQDLHSHFPECWETFTLYCVLDCVQCSKDGLGLWEITDIISGGHVYRCRETKIITRMN